MSIDSKLKSSMHAAIGSAIRQTLKKAFPKTKFSVRSQLLTGGYVTVSIGWVNGPKLSAVLALTKDFKSKDDHSADLADCLIHNHHIDDAFFEQVERTHGVSSKQENTDNLRLISKVLHECDLSHGFCLEAFNEQCRRLVNGGDYDANEYKALFPLAFT